jgi:hypothetical protein
MNYYINEKLVFKDNDCYDVNNIKEIDTSSNDYLPKCFELGGKRYIPVYKDKSTATLTEIQYRTSTCEYEAYSVCPFCGRVNMDSCDFENTDMYDCDNCGSEIEVMREVRYCTSLIKQPNIIKIG